MSQPSDAAAWARAGDPRRRVGRAIEFHATIGSTNDRAAELLRSGSEGVAVVADRQTRGRGRRGRTWLTAAGRNLALSVGIRPQLAPGEAGLLAIAAALAVSEACAAASGRAVQVRWPNDIVAPDGAKLAGLLIETALEEDRLTEAVIGIGVNVNWRRAEMPDEIRAGATSLAELAGGVVDRVALAAALLDALEGEIAAIEAGASPIERFAAVSALEGRVVAVEVGSDRVDGVVAGYAPDGSLLLDTAAGRLALTSGEVVAVRDAVALRAATGAPP